MVVLGSKNSRMRDFFDVHALAKHPSFDGTTRFRTESYAIAWPYRPGGDEDGLTWTQVGVWAVTWTENVATTAPATSGQERGKLMATLPGEGCEPGHHTRHVPGDKVTRRAGGQAGPLAWGSHPRYAPGFS